VWPGVHIRTSTGIFDFSVDDAMMDALGVSRENRDTVAIFITSWMTLLSDSPLDPHKKTYTTFPAFRRVHR